LSRNSRRNFRNINEFDDEIHKSIKDVKPTTNHFYNKFLPADAVVVETKNIKTKYGERKILDPARCYVYLAIYNFTYSST